MLDDLSATGFYLRLAQRMEYGERLLVISQISQAITLLQGTIQRVEQQADGTYGLAVRIVQYRIFPLVEIESETQASPASEVCSRTR